MKILILLSFTISFASAWAEDNAKSFLKGTWVVKENACQNGTPKYPFIPGKDSGMFDFNEDGSQANLTIAENECEATVAYETLVVGNTLTLKNPKLIYVTRCNEPPAPGDAEIQFEIRALSPGVTALVLKAPPESHDCIPDSIYEIILRKTDLG